MIPYQYVIDAHKLPNFEAALMEAGYTYEVGDFMPKVKRITFDAPAEDAKKIQFIFMKTNCNSFKPESEYVGI